MTGGVVHDVLDPDSERGRVYHCLVGRPRARVPELADGAGLDEDTVLAVLRDLADEGVAVAFDTAGTTDDRDHAWEALPPGRVVEAVLHSDAVRQATARRAGAELERLYRFARRDAGTYGALEVVEDVAQVLAASRRLQLAARHQVRVIDVPPYSGSSAFYLDQEVLQRQRMAAGVVYRSIYHGCAFDDPVAGPNMARMIEAGEQARTLDEPPLKLALGDDDLAIVTLAADGRPGVVSLLIRPSSLLRALAAVFETLWRLAVPASVSAVDLQIDDRDRRILTLMASGATDDAIARRLGLGRRTVVRRVSALLAQLGATTRFQAGVQAARRGWL
ncbi:DNA-binding CsgD family transcriptional regulator [Kitasatospora sp. MAA19]|uniref:helix-turn-helix transcriptional regulator n=1 Tax=unclassified Kitasatospora TaxID=2633591 RepID=UPI002475CC3B|nr:LuxR C-terminal-related transcriptional regulator [Kitasatospora sp. MAA19]MDH6705726.1 DNA-binding CsgD family transcriptional regulator [Kitasatospora sp. MAA19]